MKKINYKKRFVRPYGLPVRSLRTTSPKPTDWEFELIGLNASIRQSYLWCRLIRLNVIFILRWIGLEKIGNSKMSLIYSHDTSQMPMYKGLKAREGYSFSLTSPSLFFFEHSRQVSISVLPLSNVSECDPKCEGNVRDIRSPSRPSNALYIRAWWTLCEYVRVKMTFPDLGWLSVCLPPKICWLG